MKRIYLLGILIFITRILLAQSNPKVLKDINTESNSNPTNFEQIGNYTYFSARTNEEGAELWKVNASTNAVSLVKDINSGKEGANVANLLNFNGTLLFSADDGVNGNELWKSDGTEGGTVMVKDIYVNNSLLGYISDMAYVGGKVYFSADDGVNGVGLWTTDGTSTGTFLLKAINSGFSSIRPHAFTDVNGTVFFVADNGVDGVELWKTDGTSLGTTLVKNINPMGDAFTNISELVNLGGILYFKADDGVHGEELWQSDGTTTGTVMVRDLNTGNVSSSIIALTAFNNELFFFANDGTNSQKLYKSDGTSAGTALVKNIYHVPITSFFIVRTYMTELNGKLYFSASDGVNGEELWSTDGTTAGTTMVKDINLGASGSGIFKIIKSGNTLYFRANNGVNDFELWRSNGTSSGTEMVKDIGVSTTSVSNNYSILFTSIAPLGNNKIVFDANDGVIGNELWISGGTSSSTFSRDIYLGSVGQPEYGTYSPDFGSEMFEFNNKLLFVAYSPEYGEDLWITDGTTAGTNLLKETNIGSTWTGITSFTELNGKVFFSVNIGGYTEFWSTDGTSTGTFSIPGLPVKSVFGKLNNHIYFSELNSSANTQLQRTDGTVANTNVVGHVWGNQLNKFKTVGNNLYFQGVYNFISGPASELWVSNGTANGTNLLKTLGWGSSNLSLLTGVGNTLYFTLNEGTTGRELWKSNGTSASTILLKDIALGASSSGIEEIIDFNGVAMFAAAGVAGKELWKSDGTSSGTVLVKDIYVGNTDSSNPKHLTVFDNKVYFQAQEGSFGTELYVSDGTSSGTNLFLDINPSGSSSPSNFIVGGGKLYFSADDGTGLGLYETNGTAANTQRLFSFEAARFTTMYNQYFFNGKLYFTADHDFYGKELMVYDPSLGFIAVDKIKSEIVLANLYPNPNKGEFTLTIGENIGTVDVQIYTASGVKVREEQVNTRILVQMQEMPAGVYFVRLSTKEKHQVIPFVKR